MLRKHYAMPRNTTIQLLQDLRQARSAASNSGVGHVALKLEY